MSESNVLYDSDDETLFGYSSDDSKIENGHLSVYTEEYSSDASNSCEASCIRQNVRKRARPISSSDDSDVEEDEWNWKEKDNIVNIKQFTAISGINCLVLRRLGINATPLSVFKQVFCDHFFEMIVRETNRYAAQMNEEWYPLTNDEVIAYFALCIIMSQIKKSKIDMYWSKRKIVETPIFSQIMPRKRFLAITHYLHFVDNEMVSKEDRIRKVRSVVDYLNTKFKQLYIPEENIIITESLMKFRGQLNYIQSKRERFGIKFYKLCESNSGYCYQFKIYTGQDKIKGSDEAVVLQLAEPIFGKGYTLFLDNWHSSPNLFKILHEKNTNVVGMVRKNRKNMPKKLASYKLKKGEVRTLSCRGILSLRWHEKKDVYIISTKHLNSEMVDTGKIRRKKGGEKETVSKPTCVLEYNHEMGGVDKQDQCLVCLFQCFPLMRKCVKGYKKMFFYMFDVAIYNAYILYSKLPTSQKQSIVNFRLNIAEDMLCNLSLPNYTTRGRPLPSECPTRLQEKHKAHFPEHIPATNKKQHPAKRCRMCIKQNIRSETTWQCKTCLVPLHIPKCFEMFHTLQNY